ncbi:Galactokinase [Linderina pennispora]|uniref:Galactokinase n=1 Tax=Linderina pennispora TaxID=61395 RepID=A0A1Y1WDL9_9FUNG|nr:Galactokinase [Linderina pennispora]ORX71428.1 Galactokinase [Linderina pennispora]
MSAQVPTYTALSDIYSTDLLRHSPDFIARSPGRVNIIGEHIDYCGFPVFPMAIVPDCLIAVKVTDGSAVKLANINGAKYLSREFTYDPADIVAIDNSTHDWATYFKCGYKGALEATKITNPKGMLCMIDGTVPAGSGLSSSSAFVCSSALATMRANNNVLPQKDIVETSVAAERYCNVNGGGMDQCCSIMSKLGSALFIEFHPELNTTPVEFPKTNPQIAFVVANTMVTSDKAVTAPVCYNLRVVETRIAALMLAKYLGIADRPACRDVDPLTFKVVMDEFFADQDTAGKDVVRVWIERLTAMLASATEFFGAQPEGYTREECAAYLGLSVDALEKKIHADRFPVRADRFKLLQRSQHAYSETLRVVKFREICESTDASTDYFKALGDLMNQSQDSCRDLFNCSCPELDELCSIARSAGSLGSRLTGAGWGGSSVHLVPQDRVEQFIMEVKEKYYAKNLPHVQGQDLDDAIFATTPGSGAAIFELEE